jgi:hypothetical protein
MKDNFSNLIDRLCDNGVEFVIIGGLAGTIHGTTRITQDVDICCKFTAGNLLKLYSAVKDVHPVHRINPKRPILVLNSQNADKFKNLYLGTDIGQLDCLDEVKGIGKFDDVCKNAISIQIGDRVYQVLSLDALIKSKKSLNRLQDKQDILQLQAIKETKQREEKK